MLLRKMIHILSFCVIFNIIFFSKPVCAKASMYADSSAKAEKAALSNTQMIQKLIDTTAAGEVCRIPAGFYTVSGLFITRPIILNGSGSVTLKNSSDKDMSIRQEQSHIFAVWSNDVIIDGFKFENSGTATSTGIIHYNGDNLEIRNNSFHIGQNSSGIISHGAAKNCVIDSNIFYADSGPRSLPMIQLGNKSVGARIKNNILESAFPDSLSSGFLSNFLVTESQDALVADNEFSYTGPLNNEDLYGYEDPDIPVTREAFAELSKSHIKEKNPWNRGLGDKTNPETKDSFCIEMIWIIGTIQLAAGLAFIIIRRALAP